LLGWRQRRLLAAPLASEYAGLADEAQLVEPLYPYSEVDRERIRAQGRERAREILIDRLELLTHLANALLQSERLDAGALNCFAHTYAR
jgi:hypothetical protein